MKDALCKSPVCCILTCVTGTYGTNCESPFSSTHTPTSSIQGASEGKFWRGTGENTTYVTQPLKFATTDGVHMPSAARALLLAAKKFAMEWSAASLTGEPSACVPNACSARV